MPSTTRDGQNYGITLFDFVVLLLGGALWIGAIHWLGMPEYSPFYRNRQ
jgi:hypothetical protein